VYLRVLQIFSLAAGIIAAMALGLATSASAATIVTNGSFETGTLEGWTSAQQSGGAGSWRAYSRQEFEEGGAQLAPPPSGEWAAESILPPANTDYLYQDVTIPSASSDLLTMYLYYESAEPIAVPAPDTLFVSESETAQPNQQVRVDVLKANAPIESLSPNDILTTAYASKVGDPTKLEPTVITADLSAFAGQTVRLRVADAVQQGPMIVGVDDVAIDSFPLPSPAPQPSAPTTLPSNDFTTGKLFLDRAHGGAKLDVTLPDAGRLTVADARRQIAIASRRSAAKEPPILIRTASAQTSGPQTVRVFLRPTPAAKKLLAKSGKLPFRLQLTFTPEGGQTSSQGYKGTLVKRLSPARR
jgi:hypothetical protein